MMYKKSGLQPTRSPWMTDEIGEQGECSQRADFLRFSLKGTPEDRGIPRVRDYGRGAKQHGQVRTDNVGYNGSAETITAPDSFHGDTD